MHVICGWLLVSNYKSHIDDNMGIEVFFACKRFELREFLLKLKEHQNAKGCGDPFLYHVLIT